MLGVMQGEKTILLAINISKIGEIIFLVASGCYLGVHLSKELHYNFPKKSWKIVKVEFFWMVLIDDTIIFSNGIKSLKKLMRQVKDMD